MRKERRVRSLEEREVAGTKGEEVELTVVVETASAAAEVRWSMSSR